MSQNLVRFHNKRNDPTLSVAFNDDPDSFIIGDRVWIQGIKPGYIVYIGEVQFAKGEWAGVVLDKEEGKNDGSVHGVRYFQCQPKHGLFTRLHRLSRYPIDTIDANNNHITTISTEVPKSATSVKTHRICSADGKVTTTVTRVTKSPANIPHYALPIKPTKVITTVTTTTTTLEKQPKSVLKSSCKVTSSRPQSSNHHVHF